MQFDVITLFPEMFSALRGARLIRNGVRCRCGIRAISPATITGPWMTGLTAVVPAW